jgi:hypothetical protein
MATPPVAGGSAEASLSHRRLRTKPWPAMLLCLLPDAKSLVSKGVLQSIVIGFVTLRLLVERLNVVAAFALEKVDF